LVAVCQHDCAIIENTVNAVYTHSLHIHRSTDKLEYLSWKCRAPDETGQNSKRRWYRYQFKWIVWNEQTFHAKAVNFISIL